MRCLCHVSKGGSNYDSTLFKCREGRVDWKLHYHEPCLFWFNKQMKNISDQDLCNLIEIHNSWVLEGAIEMWNIEIRLNKIHILTVLTSVLFLPCRYEKHMAFHRKFPEKFSPESILAEQGTLTAQYQTLPIYFSNVCLRFLPVSDVCDLIQGVLDLQS